MVLLDASTVLYYRQLDHNFIVDANIVVNDPHTIVQLDVILQQVCRDSISCTVLLCS